MMGQQYRNDKGAILPSWMIQGDLCYPWTVSPIRILTHILTTAPRKSVDFYQDEFGPDAESGRRTIS